jgi:tryptophan synthase
VDTAYHVGGSVIGPHPFPAIVRTLQTVLGEETKAQMLEQRNKLPNAVVRGQRCYRNVFSGH